MYESLGLRDLEAVLSCERDGALIEGFNPEMALERPQTILGRSSLRLSLHAPRTGGAALPMLRSPLLPQSLRCKPQLLFSHLWRLWHESNSD
jgi:hypothetical protein